MLGILEWEESMRLLHGWEGKAWFGKVMVAKCESFIIGDLGISSILVHLLVSSPQPVHSMLGTPGSFNYKVISEAGCVLQLGTS